MKEKLGWYINRLRAMSPEEIVARGNLVVKKQNWQRRKEWVAPQPSLANQDVWKLPPLTPETTSERQAILDEADRYLQGKYTLLNLYFEEPKIDWHLDPQTNITAPVEFALEVNYREADLVGNIKNTWEKNRHHHLTILALAYSLTKNEDYAIAVEQQLLSWLTENPTLQGVNWASSLELGVRLISWVWCDRLLQGSQVHERLFGDRGSLWSSIYWHQWLIAQHYSHGSSSNNHLVGEMAGLFIAASLFPVFPESNKWQSLARKILEREVSRQTFPSGINREQAFDYQIFSLEFFLLAGIEAERLEVPFSNNYQDWVRRMLEVIPSLVDVGGNRPQYGDGDEGMALQLRPLNSSRLDWLYRLGRQWLNAKVSLPGDTSGLLASTLIAPDLKDEVGEVEQSQGSVGFDDAGLFVLASERGRSPEVFCLADAGCLGFLSIAAHGHADALSFTLSVAGQPIIVDPGTYIYHTQPEWRGYFRSTKAHNTVLIDNVDQSEPAGNFLWTKKAETKVLSWEKNAQGATLVAEHDGYMRLSEGVIHRRCLALEGKKLELTDDIQGTGVHDLEWRIHFAPQCTVHLTEDRTIVTWQEGKLEIHLDSQLQWHLAQGQPEAGWYSSGFNLKQPTYTLIGSVRTSVPISFKNLINIL